MHHARAAHLDRAVVFMDFVEADKTIVALVIASPVVAQVQLHLQQMEPVDLHGVV
jgi:hypothetical protein